MESEKTLCIMGLFDQAAFDAFLRLRRLLTQNGFETDNQPPHLTFGIYDGIDEEEFSDWIAGMLAPQHAIPLVFHHIGVFQSGTVFAEPCASMDLLDLHRRLYAKYDRACLDANCLYSLKANRWVPHATLLTVPSQAELSRAIPVLLNGFSPIKATITRLAITRFPPMETVRVFPLQEA